MSVLADALPCERCERSSRGDGVLESDATLAGAGAKSSTDPWNGSESIPSPRGHTRERWRCGVGPRGRASSTRRSPAARGGGTCGRGRRTLVTESGLAARSVDATIVRVPHGSQRAVRGAAQYVHAVRCRDNFAPAGHTRGPRPAYWCVSRATSTRTAVGPNKTTLRCVCSNMALALVGASRDGTGSVRAARRSGRRRRT